MTPNKVYEAILEAQKQSRALVKDARNDFGQYDYVSTEAMIQEAKTILSSVGLSVIPVETSVRRESEGDDFRILHRKYLVADGEGNTVEMHQEWAVVPGKGRPWDKAVASAATTSLNYFLRDLLQIPRVDAEDDMDHPKRDEAEGSKPERSKQEPQKKQPACPRCGKTDSIIKGAEQYGGGWVCWKKRGGCGEKWPEEKEPFPNNEGPSLEAWRKRIVQSQQQLLKLSPDGGMIFKNVCTKLGINDWQKLTTYEDYKRLFDALLAAGNEETRRLEEEMQP
jgi:hypothetical protein